MGRLTQSSPSDNESPQRGLPPTAPPQSPPLQDNNGYATDDIYEEFDERRQSSGSASTRTFSVTNETQLKRMFSDSVDTMASQTKINQAYVNSHDDQTEPKSVYSEGNKNNQVVTETIVHRDAMFASATVGVEGGGNATSAETPVIGAAASSSNKFAKSSNFNPMEKKSFQAQLKERLSNMRHGIRRKARKLLKGFQL